jgi:hypothetical protein
LKLLPKIKLTFLVGMCSGSKILFCDVFMNFYMIILEESCHTSICHFMWQLEYGCGPMHV